MARLNNRSRKAVMFSRYLDTAGDGTGTKNAIGNYSSSATNFYTAPRTVNERLFIYKLSIFIEDTGGGWAADNYGAQSALSNGITVWFDYNTTTQDLTDGVPIKSNAEWSRQGERLNYYDIGAGSEFVSIDWDFDEFGKPIQLEGTERLGVTLNDDFSGGITEHYFVAQGFATTLE